MKKSVQNQQEAQPAFTLLDNVNKMDELHSRLSFIQDALSQSSDWMADSAATGMFFTIQSIMDDLGDVSRSVHSNLKALPQGGVA